MTAAEGVSSRPLHRELPEPERRCRQARRLWVMRDPVKLTTWW